MDSVLGKFDISKATFYAFSLIFILGLVLRLYPGKDHFLWIYDQARDAYVTRSIIQEKNAVLVGPQTDYPGLNHGPLAYYLLAPLFFISQGDPNLPGVFMILVNLSTLVPLGLLVQSLFKDKKITWLSMVLFAISYEQIEYARWIFNFSFSIPLLVWAYYFLWTSFNFVKEKITLKNIPNIGLAGFFLGLAIQGELFLLYLIPFFLLFLYWWGSFKRDWWKLVSGLAVGLAPFFLAEIKFNFMASKTFLNDFLASHTQKVILSSQAIFNYLDHLSVTVKHTVFGFSYPMALWFFIILIGSALYFQHRERVKRMKAGLVFTLILLFSHSLLFTFDAPLKVFLNLTVAVPLLIIVAYVLVKLWQAKQKLIAVGLSGLILFFALFQLYTNTKNQTPFELYNFIQTGMLFSQKMDIVEAMYELAGDEEAFSLDVLGVPYGVRTVWASVFEQEYRRSGRPVPIWSGYRANGYPADDFFQVSDHPKQNHIFLIESNQFLLPEKIGQDHQSRVEEATSLIEERELYGYTIQLRRPITVETPDTTLN